MKALTRDKHKARHQPGYNRRRRNERRRKFKTAGVPQIEDSHLLDGAEQDPEAEEIAAKIIAAACEQFKPNHWPEPERVLVVEEVDCDD